MACILLVVTYTTDCDRLWSLCLHHVGVFHLSPAHTFWIFPWQSGIPRRLVHNILQHRQRTPLRQHLRKETTEGYRNPRLLRSGQWSCTALQLSTTSGISTISAQYPRRGSQTRFARKASSYDATTMSLGFAGASVSATGTYRAVGGRAIRHRAGKAWVKVALV